MRVGTDAVLLGAWADINFAKKILEVGTGSGVIALMLAQKNSIVELIAIDIHSESVEEAEINFKNSLWSVRLQSIESSIQEFAKNASLYTLFDTIISNPPFFTDSTPAPNKSRHQARHTDTLSPREFFENCSKLLSQEGKISLILPYYNLELWLKTAETFKLFPSRMTNVVSYLGKLTERVLIEFSYSQTTTIKEELFIRNAKGLGYTEEYKKLTGDFYL